MFEVAGYLGEEHVADEGKDVALEVLEVEELEFRAMGLRATEAIGATARVSVGLSGDLGEIRDCSTFI